jgi:hypothetical protein
MITTINYAPSYLQGAYNPIIWSVTSNKINEIDFKYVFDIYKDGVKIIRIKQRANPAGAGMIDISTLTQGYLLVNEPNNPILQGETTIDWQGLNHIYADNGTMSAHFEIYAGEEYTSGGITQIYNGVTNVPGTPAFILRSATAVAGLSIPVHVWPSSVEYRQQQWAMSNYSTISGAYGQDPATGRIYDHALATTLYDSLAYPLMFNQLEQDLYPTDKMVLSWINWSPYVPFPKRIIYGFRFKWYNAAGSLVRTDNKPCITATGYDARPLCTDLILAQLDAKYDLIHVLASPHDLAWAVSDGTFTAPVGGRIEIQGFDASPAGACALGTPITEKVTINLLEECEPALYPRVRLSWLNALGGRDYLNFTMFTEKTIETTQSTYAQEQMQWSSLKPIETSVTYPINNLGIAGGDKIYNKQAKTTYKIMTDWLDQEQANLLESLIKSPQVIAYIHDGNDSPFTPGFGNEFAYTVNVKQNSYATKNVRQLKLVQGTFDIEVALQQKIQNT